MNLSVKDINRTIQFFTKLGFTFNPQFTDENATCMIVGQDILVMLLVEKFFKTFTKRRSAIQKRIPKVIMALSTESREKVDQMMNKIMQAGGKESSAAGLRVDVRPRL